MMTHVGIGNEGRQREEGVLVNDASSCLGMSQSVFRLGPYPLKQCLAKVEQNSSIAMNFRGPLCICNALTRISRPGPLQTI